MLLSYVRGQTSVILRVKILDSSLSTGAGKTGLTSSSSGLIISTIASTESTATAYTQGSSNVETITTLGTFAAPTSGKCRFKEVDSTNHPGVYEIQIADARFAVSSAKHLLVSISGVSGAAQCDAIIPLTDINPYDAVRAGLTALPNAAAEASGGLYTRGSGAGQINQSNNGQIDANAARTGGTTNTGRDIGASVLLSSGTGTGQVSLSSGQVLVQSGTGSGQLSVSSGVVKADVSKINTDATAASRLGNIFGTVELAAIDTAVTPGPTQFSTNSLTQTVNDAYKDHVLHFISGTNSGINCFVTSSSYSTGETTLNVTPALPNIPSSTDQFIVLPAIAASDANLVTIKGQSVTCSGGVTVPAATLASTTNITAGTITTATNLTNAPTSGDFTSTMKTSIGTAVAASAVASVTAGVTLADDAITASKFDESTAFPLKSADTGSTTVARTGADGDTLETLSDQIDGVGGGSAPTAVEIADEVETRTIARVTLVDTCTSNTDMRGTDNAATATEMAKVPKSDSNVTWNATALASINAEADTALSDYGALKPTTAGRTLDVSTGGEAGIDWANIGSKTTTNNLSGTTVGSVSALGAGAIADSSFTTDAITANALAASAVIEIRSVVTGTAASGTTTTLVDSSRTEADDDYWRGAVIFFTTGASMGQNRIITGFNASTDTITFYPPVTHAISAFETYEIRSSGYSAVALLEATPLDTVQTAITGGAYPISDPTFAFSSSLPAVNSNVQQWRGSTPTSLSSGSVVSSLDSSSVDDVAAAVRDVDNTSPASGGLGDVLNSVLTDTGAIHTSTTNIEADLTVMGSQITTLGTNQTTILNRIGAFTGSGVNTILGFFKALLSKAASTPSDIGGTFDASTDAVEAIRDRGDAAWTTATSVTVSDKTGFSLTAAYDAAKTAAQAGNQMDLVNAPNATAITAIQSGLSTLTQANVRTAVGLASANLDTQLDALPTADDNATAILAAGDIDGYSFEEAQKISLAALAGILAGAATNTVTIKAADGSKVRITATVDADGNRSALTLDAT